MENIINNWPVITHILLNIPPANLVDAILFIGKKGYVVAKDNRFREWYKRKWLSPFFQGREKKDNKDYITYNAKVGSTYTMIPKKDKSNYYRFIGRWEDKKNEIFVSIMPTRHGELRFGSLVSFSYFTNIKIEGAHKIFLEKIGKQWWLENNGKEACEDFKNTLILHKAWLDRPWLTEKEALRVG